MPKFGWKGNTDLSWSRRVASWVFQSSTRALICASPVWYTCHTTHWGRPGHAARNSPQPPQRTPLDAILYNEALVKALHFPTALCTAPQRLWADDGQIGAFNTKKTIPLACRQWLSSCCVGYCAADASRADLQRSLDCLWGRNTNTWDAGCVHHMSVAYGHGLSGLVLPEAPSVVARCCRNAHHDLPRATQSPVRCRIVSPTVR